MTHESLETWPLQPLARLGCGSGSSICWPQRKSGGCYLGDPGPLVPAERTVGCWHGQAVTGDREEGLGPAENGKAALGSGRVHGRRRCWAAGLRLDEVRAAPAQVQPRRRAGPGKSAAACLPPETQLRERPGPPDARGPRRAGGAGRGRPGLQVTPAYSPRGPAELSQDQDGPWGSQREAQNLSPASPTEGHPQAPGEGARCARAA